MRKNTSTCILGVLFISQVWSTTSGRQQQLFGVMLVCWVELAGQEFATFVRPVRRRDQQARRTLSGLGSCLR